MKFRTFAIATSVAFSMIALGDREASASGDYLSGPDTQYCNLAAKQEERARGLPDSLLQALSIAESGRRNETTRQLVAWPWTVMAENEGRYFPSKTAAVTAVNELLARGVKNIDVGCMQINLMHHGDAFDSVETALDPESNVAYGARYLAALYRETDSWFTAVKRYHSAKPKYHLPYRGRVFRIWRHIKERRLAAGTSQTAAETHQRIRKSSNLGKIRPQTIPISDGEAPIAIETQQNRWRDAYHRAGEALSEFERRSSALRPGG